MKRPCNHGQLTNSESPENFEEFATTIYLSLLSFFSPDVFFEGTGGYRKLFAHRFHIDSRLIDGERDTCEEIIAQSTWRRCFFSIYRNLAEKDPEGEASIGIITLDGEKRRNRFKSSFNEGERCCKPSNESSIKRDVSILIPRTR